MTDKKYLGFLTLLIIPIYIGYHYVRKENMKIKLNRNFSLSKTRQTGGRVKTKNTKKFNFFYILRKIV